MGRQDRAFVPTCKDDGHRIVERQPGVFAGDPNRIRDTCAI